MTRYQVYFTRGNDIYVECAKLRMTPDTLVVEDDEGQTIAEFYRAGVVGWRVVKEG